MAETILTAPPVVTLRSASSRPYDAAMAAARTCYSPRVIGVDEVTPAQRDSIGPLTFDGGHHTVFQHAHFEFGLENVSRQFVWSFLHSHPFYNSEQSSQRFVRLDEIRAFVPEGLSPEARRVYEDAVLAAWPATARSSELLKRDTHAILSDLRHLTPDGFGEAAQEGGPRGGEEGHRGGALRHSRRGLHVDGPHGLGNRAPPPAPDDAHGRHAARERPRRSGDGAATCATWTRRSSSASATGRFPRTRSSRRRFPRVDGDGDALAAALDARLGGADVALVDYMAQRRRRPPPTPCGRCWAPAPRLFRRRGARPRPRSRPEPLSSRDAAALGPLAPREGAPPLELHVPEAPLPHRRQPGPAPPDGAGLASAHDVHRHGAPRLRHAAAHRRERRGAGELYAEAMDARLGREEPAAGAGRAPRVGAVPAAQRQGAALPRDREPPVPRPQVGHAHLLQRAGGDLRAPRWTSWSRCAPSTRVSCATWARPASSAPAASRPPAPRASISAACLSGAASPTSSGGSEKGVWRAAGWHDSMMAW